MQARIVSSIVSLIICLVFSVNSTAQLPAVKSSLQEAKSAIEKSYASYFLAFSKRDTALFSRHYTDDCWIMISGNSAFCGPEAPGDYFSMAYEKIGVRNGKMISIDAVGNGESFVTETGFYEFYNDKNEEIENGKYMVLWRKTGAGWKMFRICYSPTQIN